MDEETLERGHAVGGQLHDEGVRLAAKERYAEELGHGDGEDDAEDVDEPEHRRAKRRREERGDDERVDREAARRSS